MSLKASQEGYFEIVKYLVENRANDFNLALEFCDNMEIVNYLESKLKT